MGDGWRRAVEATQRSRVTLRDDDRILICSNCCMACCVQGSLMCDEARAADVQWRTVKQLRELRASGWGYQEHEDWWKRAVLEQDPQRA